MEDSIIIKPTLKYALLVSIKFIFWSILLFVGFELFREFYSETIPNENIIRNMVISLPLLKGFYRVLWWKLVTWEVTPNQIKYRRGVFDLKEDYLELFRVKDLEKEQPFILRIFRMMNFRVVTSDASHPMMEMKGIPVSEIPDIIRDLVQKERIRNRVFEVD